MLRDWLSSVRGVVRPNTFFAGRKPHGDISFPLSLLLVSGMVWGLLRGIPGSVEMLMAPGFITGGSLGFGLSPAGIRVVAAAGYLMSAVLLGVAVFMLGVLLLAAVTHLLVRMVGGAGFARTLEALASLTAGVAVLAWLPVVGTFAPLYAVYPAFVAVKRFHGLSRGRAVVVLLPVILLALVGASIGLRAVTRTFLA